MGLAQSGCESPEAQGLIRRVFGDFFGATITDPDHSQDEYRFITIGRSYRGRMLIVAHADDEERVRIISARILTRSEKKAYEENKNEE